MSNPFAVLMGGPTKPKPKKAKATPGVASRSTDESAPTTVVATAADLARMSAERARVAAAAQTAPNPQPVVPPKARAAAAAPVAVKAKPVEERRVTFEDQKARDEARKRKKAERKKKKRAEKAAEDGDDGDDDGADAADATTAADTAPAAATTAATAGGDANGDDDDGEGEGEGEDDADTKSAPANGAAAAPAQTAAAAPATAAPAATAVAANGEVTPTIVTREQIDAIVEQLSSTAYTEPQIKRVIMLLRFNGGVVDSTTVLAELQKEGLSKALGGKAPSNAPKRAAAAPAAAAVAASPAPAPAAAAAKTKLKKHPHLASPAPTAAAAPELVPRSKPSPQVAPSPAAAVPVSYSLQQSQQPATLRGQIEAQAMLWQPMADRDHGADLINQWVFHLRSANSSAAPKSAAANPVPKGRLGLKAAAAAEAKAAAEREAAALLAASSQNSATAWVNAFFESQALEMVTRKLITGFYTKTSPDSFPRTKSAILELFTLSTVTGSSSAGQTYHVWLLETLRQFAVAVEGSSSPDTFIDRIVSAISAQKRAKTSESQILTLLQSATTDLSASGAGANGANAKVPDDPRAKLTAAAQGHQNEMAALEQRLGEFTTAMRESPQDQLSRSFTQLTNEIKAQHELALRKKQEFADVKERAQRQLHTLDVERVKSATPHEEKLKQAAASELALLESKHKLEEQLAAVNLQLAKVQEITGSSRHHIGAVSVQHSERSKKFAESVTEASFQLMRATKDEQCAVQLKSMLQTAQTRCATASHTVQNQLRAAASAQTKLYFAKTRSWVETTNALVKFLSDRIAFCKAKLDRFSAEKQQMASMGLSSNAVGHHSTAIETELRTIHKEESDNVAALGRTVQFALDRLPKIVSPADPQLRALYDEWFQALARQPLHFDTTSLQNTVRKTAVVQPAVIAPPSPAPAAVQLHAIAPGTPVQLTQQLVQQPIQPQQLSQTLASPAQQLFDSSSVGGWGSPSPIDTPLQSLQQTLASPSPSAAAPTPAPTPVAPAVGGGRKGRKGPTHQQKAGTFVSVDEIQRARNGEEPAPTPASAAADVTESPQKRAPRGANAVPASPATTSAAVTAEPPSPALAALLAVQDPLGGVSSWASAAEEVWTPPPVTPTTPVPAATASPAPTTRGKKAFGRGGHGRPPAHINSSLGRGAAPSSAFSDPAEPQNPSLVATRGAITATAAAQSGRQQDLPSPPPQQDAMPSGSRSFRTGSMGSGSDSPGVSPRSTDSRISTDSNLSQSSQLSHTSQLSQASQRSTDSRASTNSTTGTGAAAAGAVIKAKPAAPKKMWGKPATVGAAADKSNEEYPTLPPTAKPKPAPVAAAAPAKSAAVPTQQLTQTLTQTLVQTPADASTAAATTTTAAPAAASESAAAAPSGGLPPREKGKRSRKDGAEKPAAAATADS